MVSGLASPKNPNFYICGAKDMERVVEQSICNDTIILLRTKQERR